ncbi:unnamed protein product [Paramecium primaurelia]|uniref:Uncharacterized protein n=1 Tax=Paramecium primaurelia TaxID=5886 RepID=A0A8S1PJD4_PARPR|nr:unnamed protein product [Paramecium primaurelia]
MGDKKKKGDQVEDFSTEQLNKLYRKRCEINGVPLCKIFKERLEAVCSEGEHLQNVKLWEEMGPVGVRAMMESFTEIGYKHLKQLRLWRVKCQDEGVRTICLYIDKVRLLEVLDLLDNQIGVLGCKFLSDILHPKCESKLVKLKLDHNQIGSEGLAELTKGLAMNNTLESLALNYCGIEADGARYLQDILANVNSKLYKLKLSGNRLKNEGAYELFRALEINNTLERIKLADNQFHSDPSDQTLINKILSTFELNKTLGYYDLKFNLLSDQDATKIIPLIEKNKSIFFIEISDQISKPLTDKLKSLTKKRKPKKKKKSKKKK